MMTAEVAAVMQRFIESKNHQLCSQVPGAYQVTNLNKVVSFVKEMKKKSY